MTVGHTLDRQVCFLISTIESQNFLSLVFGISTFCHILPIVTGSDKSAGGHMAGESASPTVLVLYRSPSQSSSVFR